jgi:hypothetical protein
MPRRQVSLSLVLGYGKGKQGCKLLSEGAVEWKIEFLADEQVVRVRTHGTVTLEPFMRMAAEVLALASRQGADKFLVDHSEATIGLTTIEIYNLTKGIEKLGLAKGAKAAIVYSPGSVSERDFTFYEDRAQNSGFQHRIFGDPDDAMTWLAKP